ncbi:hypothetical protein CEXT_788461 [Caerostris extrusa]|uniref:Uncharacterized protein n=1 Tax=Caerostris extrusa TaxID=172846 RepID=A0AAV4Y4W5_CAEEX|nr:hypothetical protein CEXT_788461 [Caerostris extrusa]
MHFASPYSRWGIKPGDFSCNSPDVYHLSFTLRKGLCASNALSLHMKINLDLIMKLRLEIIGTAEFQNLPCHHLEALFSKIHLILHDLSLQKGKVIVSK